VLPAALAAKVGEAAGQTFAQLLRRPEVTIEDVLAALVVESPMAHNESPVAHIWPAVGQMWGSESDGIFDASRLPRPLWVELKSVETEVKYSGYLQQQEKAIARLKSSESKGIPEWFDYSSIPGLSREMRETLSRQRPPSIGHASRLPGVTPAAVSLINIHVELQARQRKAEAAG
jgi:tRNA uridine 5-carboxymethylaminomethyl modification enzyme